MTPKYLLIAATRWLSLLERSSRSKASALLQESPEYADLSSLNYLEAYEWLESLGILPIRDVRKSREAVLLAALGDTMLQGWEVDGSLAIPSPDYLPLSVVEAAEAIGLTLEEAWTVASGRGHQLDLERRRAIGRAGEEALARHLRDRGASVDHVALWSDSHGYDLAVTVNNRESRVEVKTTTSRARLRIFLSRNEFETSVKDASWTLAVVLLDTTTWDLARVAELPKGLLPSMMPADSSRAVRWESCRLDVPTSSIVPGIPSIIADDPARMEDDPAPLWWPSKTLERSDAVK